MFIRANKCSLLKNSRCKQQGLRASRTKLRRSVLSSFSREFANIEYSNYRLSLSFPIGLPDDIYMSLQWHTEFRLFFFPPSLPFSLSHSTSLYLFLPLSLSFSRHSYLAVVFLCGRVFPRARTFSRAAYISAKKLPVAFQFTVALLSKLLLSKITTAIRASSYSVPL